MIRGKMVTPCSLLSMPKMANSKSNGAPMRRLLAKRRLNAISMTRAERSSARPTMLATWRKRDFLLEWWNGFVEVRLDSSIGQFVYSIVLLAVKLSSSIKQFHTGLSATGLQNLKFKEPSKWPLCKRVLRDDLQFWTCEFREVIKWCNIEIVPMMELL